MGSVQAQDAVRYYQFPSKDKTTVETLCKVYGYYLEKLTRIDKVRLRLALASWQTFLESDNGYLPIDGYLQDEDVCPEAETWILFEKIAPQVWGVIETLGKGSAGIVDPLMACLSYQLSEGMARK
jgi:hypothetical protein